MKKISILSLIVPLLILVLMGCSEQPTNFRITPLSSPLVQPTITNPVLPPICDKLQCTVTGFVWPTNRAVLDNNWLADSCTSWSGNNDYTPSYYHIGTDIIEGMAVGDPIYAIADGVILNRSENGWNDPNDAKSKNVGLIIEHRINTDISRDKNEVVFIAVYGHITTSLRRDNKVKAGDEIGKVGYFGKTPHLHFGIRPTNSIRDPYGRMKCQDSRPANGLDTNGFVQPIDWITHNYPASIDSIVVMSVTPSLQSTQTRVPPIATINPMQTKSENDTIIGAWMGKLKGQSEGPAFFSDEKTFEIKTNCPNGSICLDVLQAVDPYFLFSNIPADQNNSNGDYCFSVMTSGSSTVNSFSYYQACFSNRPDGMLDYHGVMPLYGEDGSLIRVDPQQANDIKQQINASCQSIPVSRLRIGERARVTYTDGYPLSMRDAARISGNKVRSIPEGDSFYVMSGPTCGDGYWWWFVDYHDSLAWIAEGDKDGYFVEPILDETGLMENIDLRDADSVIRGFSKGLREGRIEPFLEIFTESTISYGTGLAMEGGRVNVPTNQFIDEMAKRLPNYPTCVAYSLNTEGNYLQIWTRGWQPKWEISGISSSEVLTFSLYLTDGKVHATAYFTPDPAILDLPSVKSNPCP